ncbi:TetR/AcrR family transcriptional regulator [Microbacterium sp. M3]|uniref:TetR/AcrR family transcriptional regulator n=1 Tax=Microbacterium arthrosphaerae TaxID=792652 RepID=A0ABU4H2J3_9MICO|nr:MULTISPECIES: TetR/AcrR family transcriptional regulator [Microbacterium]MDW4572119.1 TetR/AcrR family transcriptional regulator [Microbacterium arthrosphaerae]MDW7605974.1 TetR/AcrR family transcriptional regulator [Microbacterium sp. M3]
MPVAVPASAPRTRPRDRKRRIEEAAALAFAQHGYHAVGMQDIAAAVGISAPALYRHFPNKYALFVRTAFALAHRLIESTDGAAALPLDSAGEARAALEAMVDAVIATTIELRATGGIYRWEGRYLERDDRELLTSEFRTLRHRFEVAHAVYRPDVDETDRRLLVLGALSAIASISAHRTAVGARALRALLADAAWRALDGSLPGPAQVGETDAAAPPAAVAPAGAGDDTPPGRRGQLIDAAIRLFAARGYNEVTIEDIAVEVDLTPSGVYRHFDGKSTLLLAACDRAAVSLERAALRARESSDEPAVVLARLVRAYVAHTFAHLSLTRVYFSEIANLAPDEQRRLRALQRAHVADWVALLQSVRPELSGKEAAVLVHAGLGVVADQAPLLDVRDAVAAERLARLVEIVLGVAPVPSAAN